MNIENWESIKKELAVYGIRLLNQNVCYVYYKDKYVPITISRKIKIINGSIKNNVSLITETLESLKDKLNNKSSSQAIDPNIISLFIFSLKDLVDFYDLFFLSDKNDFVKFLYLDFKEFSKETMIHTINSKITIDWIYRTISILSYVRDLLRMVSSGKKIDKFKTKTARGVSGPWANLDLPLKERKFEWKEIEDEMTGRQWDIKKQRRYKQGLENYNTENVGEGYYWRELRNEPFSWENRDTDSPYPSLKKW